MGGWVGYLAEVARGLAGIESAEQEYQELGPGSQTLVRFFGRVQNQDESVGPTE